MGRSKGREGATWILLWTCLALMIGPGMSYELLNEDYWEYFGHEKPEVCDNGKSQSPIMLSPQNAVDEKIGSYHLTAYITPLKLRVKNNGHTAVFTLAEGSLFRPTISKGPLSGSYELAQFHFHWGVNDSMGSEHTFEGRQFPLEVHLVHFKKEYGSSIKEAVRKVGKGDNLAVVGVLFEISQEDNEFLDPLIQSLEYVKEEDATWNLERKFSLKSLLPYSKDGMFVYNGSLTTPGCNEFVIWNVFESTAKISTNQLNKFRDLLSNGKHLVNNFRTTQSQNARRVRLLH